MKFENAYQLWRQQFMHSGRYILLVNLYIGQNSKQSEWTGQHIILRLQLCKLIIILILIMN